MGTARALLTGLGGGAQGGFELLAALGFSPRWATGCLVSSCMTFCCGVLGCAGTSWREYDAPAHLHLLPKTTAPGGLGLCRAGAEWGPLCSWL